MKEPRAETIGVWHGCTTWSVDDWREIDGLGRANFGSCGIVPWQKRGFFGQPPEGATIFVYEEENETEPGWLERFRRWFSRQ